MISSLVTDANRDAIFSLVAQQNQSLTSQSARAFNAIHYFSLYNNKINARALIGQSAMVYYAGKPMETSHRLRLVVHKLFSCSPKQHAWVITPINP